MFGSPSSAPMFLTLVYLFLISIKCSGVFIEVDMSDVRLQPKWEVLCEPPIPVTPT